MTTPIASTDWTWPLLNDRGSGIADEQIF